MVMDALVYLNAEKALSKVGLVNGSAEKVVEAVAAMTTISGLIEKKAELTEIAAPYIEKAKDAEGRKELAEQLVATQLVQDGKAMLDEKVVQPLQAKYTAGKELAAPYVTSVKESATYQTSVKKLEEIRKSERVEKMIAAFQAAREHPAEKVAELKEKAVDLIKYENLKAYREHVMSEQFQADTVELVKVTLPKIASDAAKRGAETVKTAATTLSVELDAYKVKAVAFVTEAKEKASTKVPTKEEVEALRAKLKESAMALLSELQGELSTGYEMMKADGFKLDEVKDRLKNVVGIVDKIVISPTKTYLKEQFKAEEPGCEAECANGTCEKPCAADPDARPLPVNGTTPKKAAAPVEEEE